jgi:hypothetical protein
MPKRLRTLKVDDADWEQWKGRAEQAGSSLSEWIRERCNGAAGTNRDMPRSRGVHVAKRRVGSVERPAATALPADSGKPSGPISGGFCESGHPLELGSKTKCSKWGCKFYAYAR